MVLSGNDGCNEIFRSSNTLMSTCKRPDGSEERNRGGGFKFINRDKLPELQLVAEYEIVVFLRQSYIRGVRRVRETLVRPQLTSGKGRHNTDHLQQCRLMLSRDLHIRVHVLEKLQENTRS